MAGLKIFVSSTCYDLAVIRTQLRSFIQNLGHEPIMSDYNDFLYHHKNHTHTSCVDEVATVDIVILIIGSRFGGDAVQETFNEIDFERLMLENPKVDDLKSVERYSVTQLEILKAVEANIPIFTFVDNSVWHDHELYSKNKHQPAVLEKIVFPSIEKQETAKYIFQFIDFVRKRSKNNAIFPFARVQEIEDILRKHWSNLFQRLLNEDRTRMIQSKRIDDLTEKFDELRTSIVNALMSDQQRKIADAIVHYKDLVNFVRSMGVSKLDELLKSNVNDWYQLLNNMEINYVIGLEKNDNKLSTEELMKYYPIIDSSKRNGHSSSILLIKSDMSGYFEFKEVEDVYYTIISDWEAFNDEEDSVKGIIVNAISDMDFNKPILVFHKNKYDTKITMPEINEKSNNISRSDFQSILKSDLE
ncbi:MAG: DUF4062 domain-containing protein [Moraxellaceae bacterium]|nr:MAG: DUF4062 domain-containing protein [Moraxellaceae bacterium]